MVGDHGRLLRSCCWWLTRCSLSGACSAFIQGRLGPNRVGSGGVLQPFADFIKIMIKEDLVPDQSTRFIFLLAPMIAVVTAHHGDHRLSVRPDDHSSVSSVTFPLVIARFDVALLYVLGVTSVGVYGIALAGWSSNNKYSLMGGLRSAAQMISYELALGLVADRRNSACPARSIFTASSSSSRAGTGMQLEHLLSAARFHSLFDRGDC